MIIFLYLPQISEQEIQQYIEEEILKQLRDPAHQRGCLPSRRLSISLRGEVVLADTKDGVGHDDAQRLIAEYIPENLDEYRLFS